MTTMKTRFSLLVLSFIFALPALAAKPAKPRFECEVKVVNGNKRVEIVCKSRQAFKPGARLEIEVNINSNPNYPEAV